MVFELDKVLEVKCEDKQDMYARATNDFVLDGGTGCVGVVTSTSANDRC